MEMVLIVTAIVIALVMFKHLGLIVAVVFLVAGVGAIMNKTGLSLGQMASIAVLLSLVVYIVVARLKGAKSDSKESKRSASELDDKRNEGAWKS